MKIKKDFVLRQVAQTWMVLPLGEENERLGGILNLTESGALLWKRLEQGCEISDLVEALTGEYDVSEEKALADATKFTDKLAQLGCLEAE